MNQPQRRLLGVTGIALGWGIAFALVFVAIGTVIGIVDPASIDPGEEPWRVSWIGGVVGLVSGALFGMLLAVAENHKSVADLAVFRVALWGAIAAAVWPLLTPVDDRMVYMLSPLGALCAVVLVGVARRGSAPTDRPGPFDRIGRLFAKPLRAVCASQG